MVGGAAAWPLAARAQQPAIPVIGFVHMQNSTNFMHLVDAFRRGLSETGYVEGKTARIEYRWAENQIDRVPALVADLLQHNVSVIFATGGAAAPRAAKAATSTVPIVFTTGSDPVVGRLVSSLNRPGGNITGVSFLTDAMGARRLGLLREVTPQEGTVAVLLNPKGPDAELQLKDVPAAAQSIGQPIHILNASSEVEINSAFEAIIQMQARAILVGADPFFNSKRYQIIALAARHMLPAMYELREFVAAGGLISYGASLSDAYRQAGVYTGRVLNGAIIGDLPVLQPTKFELAINLNTAKALGITIPASLLASADEVIE
jgi:putative ABC transport system substrate-binding protein